MGSQNHILRDVRRYVTVNCCRLPALRGFGQAVPSVSFWIRDNSNILRDEVIVRDSETWKEFLERHWDLIVATDFFTVEVWTRRGLQRFLVLFFIDMATRKVEIVGIAPVVNGFWMRQVARNLTGADDECLRGRST